MKLKSLALVSVFLLAAACTPTSTKSMVKETTSVHQSDVLEGLVEDVRIVELPNIHNASVENIVTLVRDTKSQKLFGIIEQDFGSPTLNNRKVFVGRNIRILTTDLKQVTDQVWEKLLKDASGKDASYLKAGTFGADMSLFRTQASLSNQSLNKVLKDFEAKFANSEDFCSDSRIVKTLNPLPQLNAADVEKLLVELAGSEDGSPSETKFVDKDNATNSVKEFLKDVTVFDAAFAKKVAAAAKDDSVTMVSGGAGLMNLNDGLHLTFIDSKNSEIAFFAVGGCH